MRRLTSSGTASLKMACLSAIDEELSIMNKRSILLTLFCLTSVTTRAVTSGVAGATGRSRHPLPTMETDVSAAVPMHAARAIRNNSFLKEDAAKRRRVVGNGETRMPDLFPHTA